MADKKTFWYFAAANLVGNPMRQFQIVIFHFDVAVSIWRFSSLPFPAEVRLSDLNFRPESSVNCRKPRRIELIQRGVTCCGQWPACGIPPFLFGSSNVKLPFFGAKATTSIR